MFVCVSCVHVPSGTKCVHVCSCVFRVSRNFFLFFICMVELNCGFSAYVYGQ